MKLYKIDYRYPNENNCHQSYVVGYSTETVEGKHLQEKLDESNELGDWSELNEYLKKAFKIDDSEIIFYLNQTEIPDNKVFLELQEELGVLINDIEEVAWIATL